MGIFNWHPDPGDPVVSSYFWVYWVITAPLTIAVATIVSVFIYKKSPASRSKSSGLSLPNFKGPMTLQGNRKRSSVVPGSTNAHGFSVSRPHETLTRRSAASGRGSDPDVEMQPLEPKGRNWYGTGEEEWGFLNIRNAPGFD